MKCFQGSPRVRFDWYAAFELVTDSSVADCGESTTRSDGSVLWIPSSLILVAWSVTKRI